MTLTAASAQFVTAEQVRDPDLNNCACINADTPTDAELERMIDEASDMIAIVSGFVVAGRRQLVARPCRTGYDCACPCCGLDGIPLGDRNPVVNAVKVDGTTLTFPGDYMLHNTLIGPVLVRLDPERPTQAPRSWPSNQRWWLADTEDRTFSILFTEGLDSDRLLIRDAMFEIICDMVTSGRPRNTIEGATAATMGGVTVTLDPDQVNRLRTGGFGPASSKMMAILAPGGRTPSAVWAPEMEMGWDLNLQFAA